MSGVIASLLPAIDSILGVRDQIGAVIKPVYLVTRTWYTDVGYTTPASQIGEGYAKDVQVQMLPSPGLKNFAQDIRLREGGSVKSGDIILTSVSKNSYTEAQLDGSSALPNVEKLYLVGAKLYQVINVAEKYVTWDVQLRELTNQTRY
jgi:hypothetical protein